MNYFSSSSTLLTLLLLAWVLSGRNIALQSMQRNFDSNHPLLSGVSQNESCLNYWHAVADVNLTSQEFVFNPSQLRPTACRQLASDHPLKKTELNYTRACFAAAGMGAAPLQNQLECRLAFLRYRNEIASYLHANRRLAGMGLAGSR